MSFYRPHSPVTFDSGPIVVTKQSHKAECDINTILSQYKKTGIINHINTNQPMYTDLPSDIDYQTSLSILQQSQQTFDSLPSKVREYFENNPALFLAAFHDPSQADYLREWGFLNPEPNQRPSAMTGEERSDETP